MTSQAWEDQTNSGLWPTLIKTTRPESFEKVHVEQEDSNSGKLFIGSNYLLFLDRNRKLSLGLEAGTKIEYEEKKTKSGLFSSKYFYNLVGFGGNRLSFLTHELG